MKQQGNARFDAWLKSAQPGEDYVYHVGENAYAAKLREAAYEAYERGEVELVQKRLCHGTGPNGVGMFEYIAVKKRFRKAA